MGKSKRKLVFRAFMVEKGIKNQRELAELCGVSPVLISYIVSGKRDPSAEIVAPLCRALKCNPMELFNKLNY